MVVLGGGAVFYDRGTPVIRARFNSNEFGPLVVYYGPNKVWLGPESSLLVHIHIKCFPGSNLPRLRHHQLIFNRLLWND